jgi:hypothetical protein
VNESFRENPSQNANPVNAKIKKAPNDLCVNGSKSVDAGFEHEGSLTSSSLIGRQNDEPALCAQRTDLYLQIFIRKQELIKLLAKRYHLLIIL